MHQFGMALVCGLSIGAGALGATMRYEFSGSITSTGTYAAYSGGTFVWTSWVDAGAADTNGDSAIGTYAQSLVELVISKDGEGSLTVFSIALADNVGGLIVNTLSQTITSELVTADFQFATVAGDPLSLPLLTDAQPGEFATTFVVAGLPTSYVSLFNFGSGIEMTTVYMSAELVTPVVPLPAPAGIAAAGLLLAVARRRR